MSASLRAARTPGLQYVAVNHAGIVLEECSGLADLASNRPMRAATSLMAYSMSKTITAAAVLQLVDAGRMALDAPLAKYVSAQPYGGDLTIRQLLSHSSGTPNPLPLRWVHAAADHATFDEHAALADVLRRHPRLAFRPGTKYAYSNIGYWLLGAAIEQATGQRFADYVERAVLSPLGIVPEELGYRVTNATEHATGYLEKYSLINLIKSWLIDAALVGRYAGPWLEIRPHYLNGPAFGGLVGTARGFAKFLQDQLSTRSRLFGDRTRVLFFEPQHTSSGQPMAMTLGWHTGSMSGVPYFYKEGGGGGFHCMMRLYPQAGFGSVVLTNATGVNVNAILDRTDPPLAALSRTAGGHPYS